MDRQQKTTLGDLGAAQALQALRRRLEEETSYRQRDEAILAHPDRYPASAVKAAKARNEDRLALRRTLGLGGPGKAKLRERLAREGRVLLPKDATERPGLDGAPDKRQRPAKGGRGRAHMGHGGGLK